MARILRNLGAALFLFLSMTGAAFGERAFTQGKELFLRNKSEEALPFLEAAAKEEPGNITASLYLGMTYLQLDRVDDAIAVFTRALPQGGDEQARIAYNLGNAYYLKEQYREADAFYTQAIGKDPALGSVYLNRANARLRLGSLQEAAEDYRQYLEREPASPRRGQIEALIALIKEAPADGPSGGTAGGGIETFITRAKGALAAKTPAETPVEAPPETSAGTASGGIKALITRAKGMLPAAPPAETPVEAPAETPANTANGEIEALIAPIKEVLDAMPPAETLAAFIREVLAAMPSAETLAALIKELSARPSAANSEDSPELPVEAAEKTEPESGGNSGNNEDNDKNENEGEST